MEHFFSLNDFDLENRVVALRIDLNLPYNPETKELSENLRLIKHTETIKKIADRKAKVIVLAHQGREGKVDFISLEKHRGLLEEKLEKEVKFLKYGENFDRIRELKSGEIVLLDNVRFYKDETEDKSIEEHASSELVSKLGPFIDYFVLDAFSVSHRNHASVVGFSTIKPCLMGPVFEEEFINLNKFLKKFENSESCFVLGGAKPKEPIELMECYGSREAKFLTTGVLSLLFLIAKGYDLGETNNFLRDKGYMDYLDRVSILLKRFENQIFLPIDIAIDRNGERVEISTKDLPVRERILDIGGETIKKYGEIILNSGVVCMKGPAGVYEREKFEFGTKKLFELLEKHKESLLGGGNTVDALEKLKIDVGKFGYVSLGGGASVEFLTGKELPGIKALKLSFDKFKNE